MKILLINNPLVELLDDGRLVKIHEDLIFKINNKIIIVPKDFICDGGSIPKSLWILISSPFTSKYRNFYILHDYLCKQYRSKNIKYWKKFRKEADLLLYHCCKKVSKKYDPRPRLIYIGVRLGFIPEYYKKLIKNNIKKFNSFYY